MADNVQNNIDEKKENRRLLSSLAVVVLLVAVLAIVGFCFLKEPPRLVEGQADATTVRVSGSLPGRVTEFMVKEGDMVKKGDTLVHIHSALAEAKLSQAEGMVTVAEALNKKVDTGTRAQIIQSAFQLMMLRLPLRRLLRASIASPSRAHRAKTRKVRVPWWVLPRVVSLR